ncbi:hypothetical protein D1864_03750 [Oceanobacillus picturae]|nr:hypothetical protein D1864_03750 [Oceanobacillus picturae]
MSLITFILKRLYKKIIAEDIKMKYFPIKKDSINQVLFIFFLIQPLLDLMTAFTHELPISVGAFVRTLLMAGLFIMLSIWHIKRGKSQLLLFLLPFAVILISLLINYLYKPQMNLFQEINFAMKTSYFLTMATTAIVLVGFYLSKQNLYRVSELIGLIIGIAYWLAIITNTSRESYNFTGEGYAGWFFSANELSVIILCLLGILITKITHFKPKAITWVAFILLLAMVPTIGTKTAFLGGIVLIVSAFLCIMKENIRFWQDRRHLLLLILSFLLIVLIPLSPIRENTEQITGPKYQEQPSLQLEQSGNRVGLLNRILSSRDIYLRETYQDFKNASPIRQAFGLGYAGDYEEGAAKLVEMDLFDLFFGYGVIGSIILLIPFGWLGFMLVKRLLPFRSPPFLLAVTIFLCLGISFLAGHVLLAPSVMSYLTLVIILLGAEKNVS